MDDDEIELIETFQELWPKNQRYALDCAKAAWMFQKDGPNACYELFRAIPSAEGLIGPRNAPHQGIQRCRASSGT